MAAYEIESNSKDVDCILQHDVLNKRNNHANNLPLKENQNKEKHAFKRLF